MLKSKELTVHLNYDASVEIFLSAYFQEKDGSEKLLIWNHIKNGIDIYSIKNEKAILQNKIRIPVEGPGSLIMQGFSIMGDDSIAIFPKGRVDGAILVNFTGDIISDQLTPNQISRYGSSAHDNLLLVHTSNNTSPTIYFDNKFFSLDYL